MGGKEDECYSPRTVRLRQIASNDNILMSVARESETGVGSGLATGGGEEETSEKRRSLAKRRTLVLCLAVGLCGVATVAAVVFRVRVLRACEWIGARPRLEGGAWYVSLVTVWLVCLLPTSILEVAAGFIFGFWFAAVCSTLGKFLGSLVSFGIGRHCREYVRHRILMVDHDSQQQQGYLRGLELSLKLEPFSTCLALRLAYVPEAVQNYVPAVFEAPPAAFASATLVGSGLYAMLWAKLGSQLGSVGEIGRDNMSPEKITFLCVGVVSLAVVFGLVHWNTKKTIARFTMLQTNAEREAAAKGSDAPAVVAPRSLV